MKKRLVFESEGLQNDKLILPITIQENNGFNINYMGRITITLEKGYHMEMDKIKNILNLYNK